MKRPKGDMKRIKEHFEKEADRYNKLITKVAPDYGEMLEMLILALPFKRGAKIRVADLGCGTGNVSVALKKRYPRAEVTCVDLSENMLAYAGKKLRKHRDVEYCLSDIRDFDLKGYDAVISSLCFHHLTTPLAKKKLFRKAYKGLKKGGVFYLADITLGATPYIQNMTIERWKKFMAKSISAGEINKTLDNYKHEDTPFKLADEIRWMEESGFRDVDVIWKRLLAAVYGGVKR